MIDAAVWWKALALGIIQGLTEFLPVSSSGHLVLARHWFGLEEAGVTFDVIMHLGTMFAIAIVYRKDLAWLARAAVAFVTRRADAEQTRMIVSILLGMIPVCIVGLVAKEAIESAFTDARLAAAMLLVTSVILTIGHRFHHATGDVTPTRGLVIGVCQVLALLPGISRSGTTISAAMVTGVEPRNAARFSFLMAMPLFLAAAVLQVPDMMTLGATMPAGALALGFFASFGSGLLAIKWLLRLLSRGKFVYFAVYCAALGMAALFFT